MEASTIAIISVWVVVLAFGLYFNVIKPNAFRKHWFARTVRVVDLENIYYDKVGKAELVLPYIGVVWVRFEDSKNYYKLQDFYFSKSVGFKVDQLRIIE